MKAKDARSLTPSQQETLRFTAVRMVIDQGYTQIAAAAAVGVTRQEVSRWCGKYKAEGWEGLKARKKGRTSESQIVLKPWQCGVNVRIIQDNMHDQIKMPFVLWTRSAVQELISEKFQMDLALSSISNYLKRWGMTPQKPITKAYQQDPVAVEKWLNDEYPEIVERSNKQQATIMWGDETHITNKTNYQRSYAPKGKTPVLAQSGSKFKVNMISGITNRGHVRFMCYSSTMTQNKFILFLAKLIQCSDRKIFFITDNLKVHHGKKVKAWVEEHSDEIELFYIPSYSPELNPDEYLNRDLKKNVHSKKTPRNLNEMKRNVMSFMSMLQKIPARVRKYFNSKKISYAA